MMWPMNPLDFFPILIFCISLFGMIRTDNIVKAIVCITLTQTAVIMFWLGAGARTGTAPPIGYDLTDPTYIADPLPQALMLTAIIIGISVTAVNITMLNTLVKRYRTIIWSDMTAAAEAATLEGEDA